MTHSEQTESAFLWVLIAFMKKKNQNKQLMFKAACERCISPPLLMQ